MTEQELMLMSIRQCGRADLYMDGRSLTEDESKKLAMMTARREKGEPLAYVMGEWDFMGLTLKVDRRVLIPRFETELLVERVIQIIKNTFERRTRLKILDIGTGSGNIAIALAVYLPACLIETIDVSAQAIELAKINAQTHNVHQRIQFIERNMQDFLVGHIEEKFDVLVANPPYIPTKDLSALPNDVQQEPRVALDGGEDGLKYYRTMIPLISNILKSEGLVFLEIGHGQAEALKNIFADEKRFKNVCVTNDFSDKERIVSAQLA
jgi:release factor glutamine methyltransferase